MARLNLLLLALIVFSSLALITSQHQARKLYNELQVELASAKRFEEEMGRLQIEQSTWSTPTRIEKVARERLGMRLPDAGHTRVLGNDVSARGGSQ
ncbi:MAG: cell division protein FtsL [Betaproteobacteria bacterium]|nr:cell division protein FtsL [Betaproteobacteria bacterium]